MSNAQQPEASHRATLPTNSDINALVHEMCQAGTGSPYEIVKEALSRWAAPAAQAVEPVADCYSNDDGDTWLDCPDDWTFVDGRAIGEEFELQASIRSWPEVFRVTKVPDEASDDYEVEPVSIRIMAAPAPAAVAVPEQQFKTRVYQALGIGSACAEYGVFASIANLRRRADCLSAVELEFFMVETPPDEEEGDTEPGEECLLNWGHTPEQYVKQFAEALAATPPAHAQLSPVAAQVIDNLLHLARVVERAVEDWGESFADGSSVVKFHKEEADKMESILEFFDSLPDAPPEEGVTESGPLRAARVLRTMAAPQAQDVQRDAARYRFIKQHHLILSGGTKTFGWPIAPFGDECDRYIDAAIAAGAAQEVNHG